MHMLAPYPIILEQLQYWKPGSEFPAKYKASIHWYFFHQPHCLQEWIFYFNNNHTIYNRYIIYIYMRLHVWRAHACSCCVIYHMKWSKYNSNTSLYLETKKNFLSLHWCIERWCWKLCIVSHLCTKCWCWKSCSSKLPRQTPYVFWSLPCHVFLFQTLLWLY